MIRKPMKAPTEPISDEELDLIYYPVYGSPKLDGFRAMKSGIVLTSSLKPLPNLFVQNELSDPSLDGLDGELVVGLPYSAFDGDDVFKRTSGALRRKDGEPDFTFFVFDTFTEPDMDYENRKPINSLHPRVVILEQVLLFDARAVREYLAKKLEEGYEGIMIRRPFTPYKFGRATAKEQYIFKLKPFADAEARIVGFEEQMENTNEATVNELGRTKRSSHAAGKVPKGTLGKFILKCKLFTENFGCGTGQGLNDVLRQKIWDNQKEYIDKIITFKYQKYGSTAEAPRLPIFKGFRDEWDMTNY